MAGSGAPERPSSSKKIADSVSVAPRPPYSTGQCTAAQPAVGQLALEIPAPAVVGVLVVLGLAARVVARQTRPAARLGRPARCSLKVRSIGSP